MRQLLIIAALSTGCAWKGAPPVIKAANGVGWVLMPIGVLVGVTAPNECVTDFEFPGQMECGRSQTRVALGVAAAAVGLFTVLFTHVGLK